MDFVVFYMLVVSLATFVGFTVLAYREVFRLRRAIRKHRDQRLNDRCWLDDMELYRTLPEYPFGIDMKLPPRGGARRSSM